MSAIATSSNSQGGFAPAPLVPETEKGDNRQKDMTSAFGYMTGEATEADFGIPFSTLRTMIQTQQFAGGTKTNTSFLTPLERRLAVRVLPRIPGWLQTNHLTMMTLVWSAMILLFSGMAARDLRWLWMVSLMIFLQYVTDHYDGKIGKYRNTGLVRWGYYMDHLLDYVFLCSIIIGYAFILPEKSRYQILIMLAIFAGYEVSTFLGFAATDRLNISFFKLGPTEFRLAIIVVNALLVAYGTRKMVNGLKYVNIGAALVLAVIVYKTHKMVWEMDMTEKNANQSENGPTV